MKFTKIRPTVLLVFTFAEWKPFEANFNRKNNAIYAQRFSMKKKIFSRSWREISTYARESGAKCHLKADWSLQNLTCADWLIQIIFPAIFTDVARGGSEVEQQKERIEGKKKAGKKTQEGKSENRGSWENVYRFQGFPKGENPEWCCLILAVVSLWSVVCR